MDDAVIRHQMERDMAGLRKATEACSRISQMNNGGSYVLEEEGYDALKLK